MIFTTQTQSVSFHFICICHYRVMIILLHLKQTEELPSWSTFVNITIIIHIFACVYIIYCNCFSFSCELNEYEFTLCVTCISFYHILQNGTTLASIRGTDCKLLQRKFRIKGTIEEKRKERKKYWWKQIIDLLKSV